MIMRERIGSSLDSLQSAPEQTVDIWPSCEGLKREGNTMDCSKAQSHFSEYVDNGLSARDMWELERHLAGCPECSLLAQHMQDTVAILRSTELIDTSDSFMGSLHSRLDELGPVSDRRSPLAVINEWVVAVRQMIAARPASALSVGMASLLVVAVLFSFRSVATAVATVNPIASATSERVSQEALDRHVAVIASNPFDDPVAAKLEAETGGSEVVARNGSD
jgi:anti-sigma factor RsiW